MTLALGAVQRKPGGSGFPRCQKPKKEKASLLPHFTLQFTVGRLALDFVGF